MGEKNQKPFPAILRQKNQDVWTFLIKIVWIIGARNVEIRLFNCKKIWIIETRTQKDIAINLDNNYIKFGFLPPL